MPEGKPDEPLTASSPVRCAKEEAEAKAKRDEEERIAREKAVAEEAEAKAAAAPDKAKLTQYSLEIGGLIALRPDLKTKKAREIVSFTENKVLELVHTINEMIAKL